MLLPPDRTAATVVTSVPWLTCPAGAAGGCRPTVSHPGRPVLCLPVCRLPGQWEGKGGGMAGKHASRAHSSVSPVQGMQTLWLVQCCFAAGLVALIRSQGTGMLALASGTPPTTSLPPPVCSHSPSDWLACWQPCLVLSGALLSHNVLWLCFCLRYPWS